MKTTLHAIGTAHVKLDKLRLFYENEKKKYENGENSWHGNLWNRYFYSRQKLFGDASGAFYGWGSGLVNEPCKRIYDQIVTLSGYMDSMGFSWDLLYQDETCCLIRGGDLDVVLPADTVSCERFPDREGLTMSEVRALAGEEGKDMASLIPSGQGQVSVRSVKEAISGKKKEIEEKQEELKEQEKQMKEEIEKIRLEIEEKYREKFQAINELKEKAREQMEALENQLFLLDTELYSIQCFLGETVQFTKIVEGPEEPEEDPVILYQRMRFLDEEMGRYLSLYDFDWNGIRLFEDALKYREDLRDLFAPPGKSISVIRVSKNNIQLGVSEEAANMLKAYESYHGRRIGILVRNGGNLYIGWTDEDRIYIPGDNMYLTPKDKEIEDGDVAVSSSKEDVASRYFLFSILQGVLGKFLKLPKGTSIFRPNEYVVFSMAEGWIEDNRFGTFADIVKRTNSQKLQAGDMVLTTMRITRDDIHNRDYNGRSTRYEAYNNDRGRGDRNRTHDASLKNNTVYPINAIDVKETYRIHSRKYFSKCTPKYGPESKLEGGGTVRNVSYEYERTGQVLEEDHPSWFAVENGFISGIRKDEMFDARKLSPEEVYERYLEIDRKFWHQFDTDRKQDSCFHEKEPKGYYLEPYGFSKETEYSYFCSAVKSDSMWRDTVSTANLQVFPDEFLNLTYLNSVYVEYALQNRKIGGWHSGGVSFDYANSIPYLKTALAFLREREKEEAKMLEKHMELYPDWQVDVSEWRLANGYHRLTETRAKKFAKWKKGK